jgi:hypothetical protein
VRRSPWLNAPLAHRVADRADGGVLSERRSGSSRSTTGLAAHLDRVTARIATAPREILRRTTATAIRRAAIELAPALQL